MAPQSVSTDPEAQAQAALANGDRRKALSCLMEAYGDAIYRYCHGMVGAALADDVQQLTFVQAYDALGAFAGRSSLRAWLFGIARHRSLDALRRQRRRPTESLSPEETAAPGATLSQRLADRQVLEICLDKLEPKTREAVILRCQQELSYAEMSEICGDEAAALQMRVARGLTRLRRCIESRSR